MIIFIFNLDLQYLVFVIDFSYFLYSHHGKKEINSVNFYSDLLIIVFRSSYPKAGKCRTILQHLGSRVTKKAPSSHTPYVF